MFGGIALHSTTFLLEYVLHKRYQSDLTNHPVSNVIRFATFSLPRDIYLSTNLHAVSAITVATVVGNFTVLASRRHHFVT